MKLSAFTLSHNALAAGYPIIEAVQAVQPYVDEVLAVDIGSTDRTGEVLKKLGCRVLTSPWDRRNDATLQAAFELHAQCSSDLILFFEADEVFDDRLLNQIIWAIQWGHTNIGVYRVQAEANFQRVRWYPHPVHRVFQKGTVDYYPPPPTTCPDYAYLIPVNYGLLWDCSNIFRDQWRARKRQQAQLWPISRKLMVGEHFTFPNEINEMEEVKRLAEPHWTWTDTILRIPDVLRPLLGMTNYMDSQGCRVLLESL